MKKLFGKLRGRGGFSLAETLIAVAILGLMSMVAVQGIHTAVRERAQAMRLANAQNVASTAVQAVADQLRYGRILRVETDAVVLESSTYGAQVKLCLDGDGRLIAQSVTQDAGGTYTAVGDPYYLLGEKAYSGLRLDGLAFTANTAGGKTQSVDVQLSVDSGSASGGESEHLWSLSCSVSLLNAQTT